MFGGPGVGFSWIVGSLGGSLWSSFFEFSDFLMSKWELRLWTFFLVHFRWKKDAQDSGFMLLKHGKYICLRDISLFGRICLFLRFGVALGSHFGRCWRPLGTIFGFCRGPPKR